MSKNIGILEIHHGRLVPVDILRTIGRVVGKDGVEISTPFEVSLTDLKSTYVLCEMLKCDR